MHAPPVGFDGTHRTREGKGPVGDEALSGSRQDPLFLLVGQYFFGDSPRSSVAADQGQDPARGRNNIYRSQRAGHPTSSSLPADRLRPVNPDFVTEETCLAVWQLGCLPWRAHRAVNRRPVAFRPILTDSLAFSELHYTYNVLRAMSRRIVRGLPGPVATVIAAGSSRGGPPIRKRSRGRASPRCFPPER